MYTSVHLTLYLSARPFTRLVLKRYLSTLNVEVDEAVDGEEAIQKVLENGEYAIIWMDVSTVRMWYCNVVMFITAVRVFIELLHLQHHL
jgi:CheY-like chemotaxis protein